MDVLWLRLRRTPGDPEETAGRIDVGHIFIMFPLESRISRSRGAFMMRHSNRLVISAGQRIRNISATASQPPEFRVRAEKYPVSTEDESGLH
jgi:hypothetical protein